LQSQIGSIATILNHEILLAWQIENGFSLRSVLLQTKLVLITTLIFIYYIFFFNLDVLNFRFKVILLVSTHNLRLLDLV